MPTSVTPEAYHFQERWKLEKNPFVFYSAEALDEPEILRLFVADPDASLAAFSCNVNNIIRGTYGSGKTMCLRAVEAFAFSQAIIDILQGTRTPVLPVKINLSEISTIDDPAEIYRALILRVFQALLKLGKKVESYVRNTMWFTSFKEWRARLTRRGIYAQDARYEELSAEAITRQAEKALKANAQLPVSKFLQGMVEFGSKQTSTLVTRPHVSIVDINDFHERYLSNYCDRILLLFDEVGSLHPSFFVTKGEAASQYENLMNQLRTSERIFYKICVYPGHYSDALQESRYGVRINLDYSVADVRSYKTYAGICKAIMTKYISAAQKADDGRDLSKFVDLDEPPGAAAPNQCDQGNGSAFEQLCFASGGVVRRLFTLTTKAMLVASKHHTKSPLVTRDAALEAIAAHGRDLLNRHTTTERSHIEPIMDTCKCSMTYRFTAELDAKSILKPFLSKTQQDSVLSVSEHETASGPAVYEFDYSFCIVHGLPTHSHYVDNEICEARSLRHARWIELVADATDAILHLSGLERGVIMRYLPDKQFGFIRYDVNRDEVFFHANDIIDFGPFTRESRLDGVKVRFAMGEGPKGEKARSVVLEPTRHGHAD